MWAARAIQVATNLGIPDRLARGAKPVSVLARETETHPDALYRLLRALASVGVFVEVEAHTFAHSDSSRYLCSNQPGSLYHLARMMNAEWHWRPWGELEYSVRTGKPAFDHLYGMDRWTYFRKHPEEGRLFDQGIGNFSRLVDRALTMAYDFSSVEIVVDVAGGHGSFLASILAANPALQGILFDHPDVLAGAAPVLAEAGVAGRYRLVAGDMFDELPPGADLYLLKEIVHNWDDDHVLQLLRHCRQAMSAKGRVLIADNLIRPGGKETSFSKFLDLEMLIGFPGRERTVEEFRALYEAAGFQLKQVIPTQSPLVLIEGVIG
jgi:hypothetical protein